MPRSDGTGPTGQGPMTGRGLGNCIKYGVPIVAGIAAAFGFGRRRGQRRGFGANFENFESKEDELLVLKEQAKSMESSLEEIKKRITEIEQK